MLRMSAFLHEFFRRLPRRPNLHQHRLIPVRDLAEVNAQTALSIVNLQHDFLRWFARLT